MKKRDIYIIIGVALTTLTAISCQNGEEQVDQTEQPVTPVVDNNDEQTPIVFGNDGVSATTTRAEGSLVNVGSKVLDATTNEHDYYVGLFGYYTGTDTWATLDAHETGSKATADFFYNQKMTIAAADGGKNQLTYSPLRFWPNETNAKLSFWAYYPWNATLETTGAAADYGISIHPDHIGTGMGMGSIPFKMASEAKDHVDFLISDLVADCTKSTYNLASEGTPKRVPLNFHHALAQVRLYIKVVPQDIAADPEKGIAAQTWDREKLNVKVSFDNIKTQGILTPGANSFSWDTTGQPLSSVTISDYDDRGFAFKYNAANGQNQLMILKNEYSYTSESKYATTYDSNPDHYQSAVNNNYNPANIIMAIPQTLADNNVPHVVIVMTDGTYEARVTINLLGLALKWDAGYLYAYAFTDSLKPGDDKVKGPETITVVFSDKWTDQW